jgi:hypothetical protein
MTTPVTHPLALATRSAHPWDDAVLASQAEAEALDARITALALVLVPSAAAEAELRDLAREISSAAGREGAGGQGAGRVLAWRNGQMQQLKGHAVRLGYDVQALELR